MDIPENVLNTISNSENILIQAHQKPDGDAIGSAIALGKGLKKLGKNVDYYIDETIEPKLKFFPEINNFNKNIKDHYDSLIIVDCSTKDFSVYPNKEITYDNLVVIDHHKSNQMFGDENFVYETGACGELIFQVLEALNIPFDEEMRQAIFTALSSDTGSFQFSNTNKQTHEIASKIYTENSNYAPISKKLHSEKSLEQLKLYASAINSIKLFHNNDIAILYLPYEEIQKYGGEVNITDDLANIGMNLDTSKISVLIKEVKPNDFKMSIRSKAPYEIDVSKIAAQYGGGGHYRASGFSATGEYEDLENKLVKDLEKLLEK